MSRAQIVIVKNVLETWAVVPPYGRELRYDTEAEAVATAKALADATSGPVEIYQQFGDGKLYAIYSKS